jgi:cell volume regulation protein A
MNSVAVFLLALAGIFLIGAIGELIFQRTNIPDVIWLILAGIGLGPLAGLVQRAQLIEIAPYFAALTLVIVLFEGGSALKLSELSKAAPRSSAIALINFLLSVFAVCGISMLAAAVGVLPDSWTFMHGLLAGVILGGSSSIIIMPAMAQARVHPRLANLVSLESALTDAFCVVGTAAIIDLMLKGAVGGSPLASLARSFGIGLAIGGVAGLIWLLFLRFLHSKEHAYPITLSALLVLYVVINEAGGSAALGILTIAVILGNAAGIGKKIGLAHEVELDRSVRGFHRQMTFIIKSFFFVFIGAMLAPPWGLIVLGGLLGLALLAARVPGTRLALLGSGMSRNEQQAATICMPRGMAAGVLATLPMTAGVPGTDGLPVAVFATVFTTIVIFAVGFPIVKSRMAAEAAGAPALEPASAVPVAAVPVAAVSVAAVAEAAAGALCAELAAVPASAEAVTLLNVASPVSVVSEPQALASVEGTGEREPS